MNYSLTFVALALFCGSAPLAAQQGDSKSTDLTPKMLSDFLGIESMGVDYVLNSEVRAIEAEVRFIRYDSSGKETLNKLIGGGGTGGEGIKGTHRLVAAVSQERVCVYNWDHDAKEYHGTFTDGGYKPYVASGDWDESSRVTGRVELNSVNNQAVIKKWMKNGKLLACLKLLVKTTE